MQGMARATILCAGHRGAGCSLVRRTEAHARQDLVGSLRSTAIILQNGLRIASACDYDIASHLGQGCENALWSACSLSAFGLRPLSGRCSRRGRGSAGLIDVMGYCCRLCLPRSSQCSALVGVGVFGQCCHNAQLLNSYGEFAKFVRPADREHASLDGQIH